MGASHALGVALTTLSIPDEAPRDCPHLPEEQAFAGRPPRSGRTAAKWLGRWRNEGEAGLEDRSSAPKRVPGRLAADRLAAVEALRRLRMTAAVLGMALSTVSRGLARIGLGKRSRLQPPEPPNRYERKRPGELIHVDVKKLVRIERGAGHRVSADPASLPEGLRDYAADPFYGILANRPEILAAWAGLDKVFFGPGSTVPNSIKEEGRRTLAQDVGCVFCASLGGAATRPRRPARGPGQRPCRPDRPRPQADRRHDFRSAARGVQRGGDRRADQLAVFQVGVECVWGLDEFVAGQRGAE